MVIADLTMVLAATMGDNGISLERLSDGYGNSIKSFWLFFLSSLTLKYFKIDIVVSLVLDFYLVYSI